MDAFEDRHEGVEELQRDGHSVLVRAVDREEGVPVLVRRLVRSRRFDVDVRAGLVAEAEYCARLACSRCPEAEAFSLEDGELVLEYKGADGVELDRVLTALEASGRVLTPAAAVALVSEVLHNAEAIARIKPPAVETEVWGHGEIAPRSVMLGRDGFGRLYEVRLATSGFRSLSGPGTALCRAPELAGGVLYGTPASDVYAVGALVSLALFGSAPLAAAAAEPLVQVVVRAADGAPGSVPQALLEVLVVALATAPDDRYRGPETLREALRTAMPLDLAGWRATAEGLAALARTMAADRKLDQVPEALFVAHPELARAAGVRPPSIDEDVAAFAQDQVLTSSQAVAAMSPLTDPRARRGSAALPRRIAVVPRRVSRAVADAFDAPRLSPVPGSEGARSPSSPGMPALDGPRPPRSSPVPATLGMAVPASGWAPTPTGGVPVSPVPWMSPVPVEVAPRAPRIEVSETVVVDEREAAQDVERLRRDGPPTLEIMPSDPAPSRPQLEIVPSDPAPPSEPVTPALPEVVPAPAAAVDAPAPLPPELLRAAVDAARADGDAPTWPLAVLTLVVLGGLAALLYAFFA